MEDNHVIYLELAPFKASNSGAIGTLKKPEWGSES